MRVRVVTVHGLHLWLWLGRPFGALVVAAALAGLCEMCRLVVMLLYLIDILGRCNYSSDNAEEKEVSLPNPVLIMIWSRNSSENLIS